MRFEISVNIRAVPSHHVVDFVFVYMSVCVSVNVFVFHVSVRVGPARGALSQL